MTTEMQQQQPGDPAAASQESVCTDYEKGNQLLEKGDLVQAAAEFHNALVGYEQDNDVKGIANACDKLGDVCLQRSEYDRALVYFGRAQAICEQGNDRLSLVLLLKKIVKAKRGLKQYDEAIRIYMDLLDAYQDFNNPPGAVQVLEDLAATYLAINDRQKAADALRTAASIHRSFKHTRHAADLEAKAETIEANG